MTDEDLSWIFDVSEAVGAFQAAEAHLEHMIIEARRHGVPWSTLGELLGVSKQAAQQRYGRLLGAGDVAG